MLRWIAVIFCLIPSLLWADIFDLKPGKDEKNEGNAEGKSGQKITGNMIPLGGFREIWREPIEINGFRSQLILNISQYKITDMLASLKIDFPQLTFAANSNAILAEVQQINHRMRYLLLSLQGRYSGLQFELELPKKLPSPEWLKGIPVLSVSSLNNTISFPDRGIKSLQFSIPGNIQTTMNRAVGEIESSEWQLLTRDIGKDQQSGCAIFLSQDGSQILLCGFTYNEKISESLGSIVVRPVR